MDRFGNFVTNLPNEAILATNDPGDGGGAGRDGRPPDRVGWTLRVLDQSVVVARSFGSVASGRLVAYAGSSGCIEVAVRDGSAADRFAAWSDHDVGGLHDRMVGLSVMLEPKPGMEQE